MDAEGDDKQQPNFSMAEVESDGSAASDPATAQSADAPESVQEGDTANVQDDTETENDSDEKDEALDVSAVETSATTEGVIVPDCQDNLATETVSESTPADHGDNPSTVEVNDTLSEEHGVENDCPMENTEGGASAPTHDESEYDPAAPVLLTAVVPHGEDEYDPANPSPAETPVGSNATTGFANHREQEEYDPDHPSMIPSAVTEEPATMEEDQISPSTTSSGQPVVTPGKRKADEMPNDSSVSTANGDSGSKRPRHVDENKSKSADEDHKHKRHRRGSGDSTTSSSSKLKEQDHKGLSDAAWDRLMDFQTSGEFRVTQVSRAAFASVGAMPEFAQIAIIARFVRTPMRDIRDKNGQLMRIYREYQKENPQVSALQSVDVFMSDYKNEPGLFRFGYAPPLPATGMSSAVENFSNVDLSQVENLQGFLVGIINRVNEKAIASEKQQRPQVHHKVVLYSVDLLKAGHPVQLCTSGHTKHLKTPGTLDVDNQQDKHLLNTVEQYEDHLQHMHLLACKLGGKCYEVLGQLSEPLANQVLTRFAGANLSNVRNKSGFLIGVVKRARQEYGFN
ncbi:hypothetical protein PHMEG_000332 [Phytophthora megakarya]|uniref:Heterogeneous nuclear ribonucleoprotein Q acidic domain-containing protein n=1 Tax=Phytophthora megakarya TaxID=4795 RepID=A0A225X4A5_9STRA|nr:hypothetical protein PHMEG_000332 [Phytophthora megakarya]